MPITKFSNANRIAADMLLDCDSHIQAFAKASAQMWRCHDARIVDGEDGNEFEVKIGLSCLDCGGTLLLSNPVTSSWRTMLTCSDCERMYFIRKNDSERGEEYSFSFGSAALVKDEKQEEKKPAISNKHEEWLHQFLLINLKREPTAREWASALSVAEDIDKAFR